MTIKPIQREKTNIVKAYKTSVPIEDKFDATSTSNSQSKGKQYASVNLQEKLQFYHLKTKSEGKQRKKTVNRVVSSVSALLPFDSVKGHYEPASFIAADKKDERYQIEDAPDSILQPWHSSEVETPSGYMYAPALGEVIVKFLYSSSRFLFRRLKKMNFRTPRYLSAKTFRCQKTCHIFWRPNICAKRFWAPEKIFRTLYCPNLLTAEYHIKFFKIFILGSSDRRTADSPRPTGNS